MGILAADFAEQELHAPTYSSKKGKSSSKSHVYPFLWRFGSTHPRKFSRRDREILGAKPLNFLSPTWKNPKSHSEAANLPPWDFEALRFRGCMTFATYSYRALGTERLHPKNAQLKRFVGTFLRDAEIPAFASRGHSSSASTTGM